MASKVLTNWAFAEIIEYVSFFEGREEMILDTPEFFIQPTGKLPCGNDLLAQIKENRLLMIRDSDNAPRLPRIDECRNTDPHKLTELAVCRYGTIYTDLSGAFLFPEDSPFFMAGRSEIRFMGLETAGIAASCLHLLTWYNDHRFCGRCGHENTPAAEMRALRCSACGQFSFPMIAPAVITAITCGDNILLARHVGRTDHLALIAGYVEVGETLEHAVHREVLEETGLHLTSLKYIGNQPWGMSGSMMFAFHATADDSQPLKLQEDELSEARWYSRSELEPQTTHLSIASELMERFRKGIL